MVDSSLRWNDKGVFDRHVLNMLSYSRYYETHTYHQL